MHFDTLIVHAGYTPGQENGAVTPPIHFSTTFARAPDGSFPHGFIYSRDGNPTRNALESLLAALEGGAAALTFASGSAATMTVFQALRPGDHVIAPTDAYFGTATLLRDHFSPWGLAASFVDMSEPSNVAAALASYRGTGKQLVWIETPSNPCVSITDIAAIVQLAQAADALVVVDNTWATPVLQRPLALGADIVMHSTTKYLGGHSDLLGGALIVKHDDAMLSRLRAIQQNGGAVPSPFDCWLVMRGIRSLSHRVRAHSAHALSVARALAEHPQVERVHYPGLVADPGHVVAGRQMNADGEARFGGMLSVCVRGARREAFVVAAALKLVTRATSLGGPETLIEHRASVEGPRSNAPENLLRVSIGLENPADILADFVQALDTL
jgi:cystathionine gamma-synthase